MQPNEFRLVRLKGVMEMTTLSKSTIYRRIDQRKFPKPINLGGRIAAWRVNDVEQFIQGGVA